MISRIFSNMPSFREVNLQAGLNIVVADRTSSSTKKDSRNGLGKSTLIDIIHFCLGSTLDKKSPLSEPALIEWDFGLEIDLLGARVIVQRSIKNPKKVYVENFPDGFALQPKSESKSFRRYFSIPSWRRVLGNMFFGLPLGEPSEPYQPSFRSLINYFIRRGENAYTNPFEHFRKQPSWQVQVDHTYLLGLSWQDARQFQVLKEKKKLLQTLNKASNAGFLKQYIGSRGELEAERVRLQSNLDKTSSSLKVFNVHPNYKEIEKEVNELTVELHDLENEQILVRERKDFYIASSVNEIISEASDVVAMYSNLNIIFPEIVKKRLEDVKDFHDTITENRKHFLELEIARLEKRSLEIDSIIGLKSSRRADLMMVISSHGPWEEYSRLMGLQQEFISKLDQVKSQILQLTEVEEHKSKLKIENELLLETARMDFREKSLQRDRALDVFNQNSEYLHSSPGALIIELTEKGFQFAIDIERSRSQGVSHMKVFCYDLMLSELWQSREFHPNSLIHDSPMFDGVDERQGANALMLAKEKSKDVGFQYLCTLNSDNPLLTQLPTDFNLDEHIRLRLTDATPEGSLLGIRF